MSMKGKKKEDSYLIESIQIKLYERILRNEIHINHLLSIKKDIILTKPNQN